MIRLRSLLKRWFRVGTRLPVPRTLKTWYHAMQKPPRREMMLSNLIYDFVTNRMSQHDVQKVVRRVADRWEKLERNKSTGGVVPERILIEAVEGLVPHVICTGPKIDDKNARLSRVTGAVPWYDNTVESTAHGLPKRDEIPDHILLDIEKNGLRPDQIQRNAQVRGIWPEAWVTRSDDLDAFCAAHANSDDLPARVRDYLGMIHYDDGDQLVRLDYPKNAVPPGQLFAPTFADGCGTRVYRSLTGAGNWGRTVDLTTGGQGAAEAVHPPIPFTSRFKVHYLNRVEGRTHAFGYGSLLANCPRRWQATDEQLLDSLL